MLHYCYSCPGSNKVCVCGRDDDDEDDDVGDDEILCALFVSVCLASQLCLRVRLCF